MSRFICQCELNNFCVLTTTESRAKIWRRSKAVVLMLLCYCFMYLPLFVGFCVGLCFGAVGWSAVCDCGIS